MENTSQMDSEVIDMVQEFKQKRKSMFCQLQSLQQANFGQTRGSWRVRTLSSKLACYFKNKGVFIIGVFLYKTGVWLHALSLLETFKKLLDISGQKQQNDHVK